MGPAGPIGSWAVDVNRNSNFFHAGNTLSGKPGTTKIIIYFTEKNPKSRCLGLQTCLGAYFNGRPKPSLSSLAVSDSGKKKIPEMDSFLTFPKSLFLKRDRAIPSFDKLCERIYLDFDLYLNTLFSKYC